MEASISFLHHILGDLFVTLFVRGPLGLRLWGPLLRFGSNVIDRGLEVKIGRLGDAVGRVLVEAGDRRNPV
jgi:hypothetical protein